MDSTIIAALISALTSVAAYVLGLMHQNSYLLSFRFKTNKSVLKEQLAYVYEPIIKILDRSDEVVPEIVQASIEIRNHHYLLIPNEILKEFNLLSRGGTLSRNQFDKFSSFIRTNYNWSKKILGYPFDDSQIDKTMLPGYKTRQNNREVLKAISSAFSGITASMFPILLWYVVLDPKSDIKPVPAWLISLIVFSGICFAIWGIIIVVKSISNFEVWLYKRKNHKKK